MNKINLLLFVSSALLVGCNNRERGNWFESRSNVQAPLPPHAPITPLEGDKSLNRDSNPQSAEVQEPSIMIPDKVPTQGDAEWSPKEGDLVRAGELMMELQKEKKRKPSNEEMISHLQHNLSLTASQAHLILDELGLE